MTNITFDIRQGGGTEPLVGGVTFTPTRTNYKAPYVTMPQPQTIGLHNGKGTMYNVDPTPTGVAPAWAYTATVINGVTGERKSWLVTVPSGGTVAFDSLPRPVEVVDPAVDVAALANSIDGATKTVSVNAAGDVLVTRVDGGTYVAGNARGPQGIPGVTDLATTTTPGLLSPTDKAKVDSAASVTALTTASRLAREATAVVTSGTYSGATYKLVRLVGGTSVPGLIGKRFGKDGAGATGTPGQDGWTPATETLTSVFQRTGADIVINAGGWVNNTADARNGYMDGAQIKDGVLYHDFNTSGSRGRSAIGFKADGSAALYEATAGDTGASMLAAGVVNSFSFGPTLVKAGAAQSVDATTISARQALAVTTGGDILILTVDGLTDSSGLTYQGTADLLVTLGASFAIPLDGGGSAQTLIQGAWTTPGSDITGERATIDFLTVHAKITGDTATNWRALTPMNDFTANDAAVRLNAGQVEYKGTFTHTTTTAATQVATAPWWAQPQTYQRFPLTTSTTVGQYVDATTGGGILMYASAAVGGPRYITSMRYPAKR